MLEVLTPKFWNQRNGEKQDRAAITLGFAMHSSSVCLLKFFSIFYICYLYGV